jgi:hypothetical protein
LRVSQNAQLCDLPYCTPSPKIGNVEIKSFTKSIGYSKKRNLNFLPFFYAGIIPLIGEIVL